VVELPRLHSILRPASLNPYAVMVGIEACPCEGRGPTIHEFACRLGKFRSPCGSTHSKKYFTTETRRSRRRNILPAGAAVEQNQLLSSFPRKAGIQGNRQGAEHVALDSRFRGNDGVGRRRGEVEYDRVAPSTPYSVASVPPWCILLPGTQKAPAICHTTAESTSNQTIEHRQYLSDEHSRLR
jgi:hypothetical protein